MRMTTRLCDSRQPMGTSGERGVTDVTRRACLAETGGSTGSVREPSPIALMPVNRVARDAHSSPLCASTIALRQQWGLKRLPSAAARSNSTRLAADPRPTARRGSIGR